jgi:hypothetical protein
MAIQYCGHLGTTLRAGVTNVFVARYRLSYMTEPTSGPRPFPPRSGQERGHSDELLASVQRLTGVGVWVHDAARDQTWWSDQAQRLHGIDPDTQPTVEGVLDRYADPDRERVLGLFDRAVTEGRPFDSDASLVGDGTTERTIRLRCEPRTRDGTVVTLHGTVRDVTDAKRREQRVEVLGRASQRLKRAHSRQAVAEVLADASKNILGLVNTTVRLIDEDRETLRTTVATEECVERAGERPDYPVDTDNPATLVFRTGEPELYADIAGDENAQVRGELVSGIYVPIGDHGVLSAGDIVAGAFDERDLEAAALLGQVGAEALTRIGWAKRSRAV